MKIRKIPIGTKIESDGCVGYLAGFHPTNEDLFYLELIEWRGWNRKDTKELNEYIPKATDTYFCVGPTYKLIENDYQIH